MNVNCLGGGHLKVSNSVGVVCRLSFRYVPYWSLGNVVLWVAPQLNDKFTSFQITDKITIY